MVRVIGSLEKSGVKLYSLSEANPRETRIGSNYREVRETEGSRTRDSTVCHSFGFVCFNQFYYRSSVR